MSDCQVCCSKYNKSTKLIVTCYFPSCAFSACKECVRTYLTSITSEPHCMKCYNKWNLEFTKSALNAVFMDVDYRNHRKVILADRAISQIPEFYEGALRYGKLSEGDLKMKEIMKTISEHRTIIQQLYLEHDKVYREMHDGTASTESRKFVMQCQNNGCRGMLTQQYKCDLCTKFTCPKCFLAIDGQKADHVCKQDDIDTVEELRKNSRPCPKCGMRISKVDGCDQMWCLECKTAFSWSKGVVEKGVIHNPHYYQWMRQHGGGMPRNPNENCGNLFFGAVRKINEIARDCLTSPKYYKQFCDYYETNRERYININSNDTNDETFRRFESVFNMSQAMFDNTRKIYDEFDKLINYFSGFHRYINHMDNAELVPLRRNIQDRTEDHTAIYKYILNEMGKEELSAELIRNDTVNMKDRAQCDILEALVIVGKQLVLDCLKDIESEASQFPNSQYISLQLNSKTVSAIAKIDNPTTMNAFIKLCVMFLPQEVECYLVNIHAILVKYKKAISKYCAYSYIEYIKYLITYGSKKTLTIWDYEDQSITREPYKSKSEMIAAIDKYRQFYGEDTPVENTFVAGGGSS